MLGNVSLGTFASKLSLNAFPWDPSLWNFRLGYLAWELSLGNFRLITYPWALPLKTFAWGIWAGNVRSGYFGLGTFAWELSLDNFRLRSFDWELSLWQSGLRDWAPEAGELGGQQSVSHPARTSPQPHIPVSLRHPFCPLRPSDLLSSPDFRCMNLGRRTTQLTNEYKRDSN